MHSFDGNPPLEKEFRRLGYSSGFAKNTFYELGEIMCIF